jgi:hypothetical protein
MKGNSSDVLTSTIAGHEGVNLIAVGRDPRAKIEALGHPLIIVASV